MKVFTPGEKAVGKWTRSFYLPTNIFLQQRYPLDFFLTEKELVLGGLKNSL